MENIPGYLATMDLVKAFDSLYRDFLLCVLKKVGFGDDFTNWVKTLLNDQPSCVINAGLLVHFTSKRGAQQGGTISAYLFMIAVEVPFALIKIKST